MSTFHNWLPVLGWMAAIIIVPWFLSPGLPSPQSLLDELIRSGIHVVEYGVLALLLHRALKGQKSRGAGERRSQEAREQGNGGEFSSAPPHLRTSAPYLLAFLIAALYAVFDEAQQGFIPNRQPSLLDFLADSLGSLLALAAIVVISRSSLQRRSLF